MGNRSRLFTRQARTLCAQATEAFKRFLSALGNFNRLAYRDDAPERLRRSYPAEQLSSESPRTQSPLGRTAADDPS